MLKILPARFKQYMNHEIPDVPAGFRKGRGTRDQIANICVIIEKARKYQKTITSALLITTKSDSLYHNKLWNIQEMGIPDLLTCLLRNLYAGQEATLQIRPGTTDFLQIRRVHQSCISSLCLFNFYAEYITQNARLDEAQAGIKIA